MTELMLFLAVGLVGGVVNAIAGGAKLFVFPLLLASGLPPIVANATGTAGVWPAQLSAALVYRKELLADARGLARKMLPALSGGLVGAFLLIRSSEAAFLTVIPFLLAIAVTAIMLGPHLTRAMQRLLPGRRLHRASALLLFACGIYGGYFGAGLGFMLIAVLSLSAAGYRTANAQKNILAFTLNSFAIVPLTLSGLVDWWAAAGIIVGGLVGGALGGSLTKVLPETATRIAVALLGIVLTASFLLR